MNTIESLRKKISCGTKKKEIEWVPLDLPKNEKVTRVVRNGTSVTAEK